MGMFFSEYEGIKLGLLVKKSNNVNTFEELRNMDMQIMVDTFAAKMESMLPSIDGYVFPEDTHILIQNGYVNGESTMIGTVIRESFTEKPFNFAIPPKNKQEFDDWLYKHLYDHQSELIKKHYPFDKIKSKIYPYGKSEFESNPASLIQTVILTGTKLL